MKYQIFKFYKRKLPKAPMITWKRAETAIAPESSLILTCHNSVFSTSVIFKNGSLSGNPSGHFHCSKFKIARVGTKNDMVPPWTSGSLKSVKINVK